MGPLRELNRRWTWGGVRYRLCVRWWGPNAGSVRYVLGSLWRLITATDYFTDRPRVELRSRSQDQDECYCPAGVTTTFRVDGFGHGCWGWLSRSWVKRPCVCDQVMDEWRDILTPA